MKKFQRTLMSATAAVGALCALAMVAPAANADTGKELVLTAQAATRSVNVEQGTCSQRSCVGSGGCVALPAHNTGAAVGTGYSVYNGSSLKVVAYNSGNCTGGSTRTVNVTVKSNNTEYWLDIR